MSTHIHTQKKQQARVMLERLREVARATFEANASANLLDKHAIQSIYDAIQTQNARQFSSALAEASANEVAIGKALENVQNNFKNLSLELAHASLSSTKLKQLRGSLVLAAIEHDSTVLSLSGATTLEKIFDRWLFSEQNFDGSLGKINELIRSHQKPDEAFASKVGLLVPLAPVVRVLRELASLEQDRAAQCGWGIQTEQSIGESL